MAKPSPIVAKFDDLFKKALTDTEGGRSKSKKEQERDYYALTTNFLNKLISTRDIDACMDRYFALYRSYLPDDSRSKMIFAILLSRRIAQTDDTGYLQDLTRILDEKQPSASPIRPRFDELAENVKREIRGDLLKALRQHETILDELKQAWTSTHKGKKVTLEDLYAFDPLPDPALQAAHKAAMDKCRKAWDECTRKLDESTWTPFKDAFDEYLDLLKDLTKESLKLFQVLKWCREPLVGKSVLVGKGRQQRTELYRAAADELNDEFYFQTAFAVFLRAAAVKQLKPNAHGFTRAEEEFFFQPLSRTYYFSNYMNHYLFGARKDVGKFRDITLWHFWLLQIGKLHNVSLVNDEKFGQIVQLFDAVVEIAKKGGGKAKGDGKKDTKRISTKGKATWEYAKDYFKIHQKIGVGANEFEIIYFEKEDTGYPDIYIEYKQTKGTLFRMDINTYISRVESHPYQLIMKNTASLYLLIIEFWGFIFTMFFPGVGYFQLFFAEGFLGVFEQVLVQQQMDFILETLSQYTGAGGGGLGGNAFPWLSILSGKKAFIRSLEKEALEEGKAEALKLLGTGESETSRFGESELGSRGLTGEVEKEEARQGWKSLPVKGEVSEAERLAGEKAAADFRKSRGLPDPPRPATAVDRARANFQKNMELLRTPEIRQRKNGGWVEAAEYDHDLIEAVKQERAAHTDLSPGSFRSNVAAVRVRVDGREEILTAANLGQGSLHSEALLKQQLDELVAKVNALKAEAAAAKGQRVRFQTDVQVIALYSEREPCSTSFCNKIIEKDFGKPKVYFTAPEHKLHPTARGMVDPRWKELRDEWLGPVPKEPPPTPPTKKLPPTPGKPKPEK